VAVLKKYNLAGQEVGEVKIDDGLLTTTANLQMIKDYLVALRANARQWSAKTKNRAEVCHSGQKPHPQKGTGRARQGYLGSPQYKGGGRVHTPRPKFDQHVRINKKERRAAIQHLLAEKIQNHRIHVLQFEQMDAPKTKRLADFLKQRKLDDKRVLFLGESFAQNPPNGKEPVSPVEKYNVFNRSMRNLQKKEFLLVPNVSGYDITVTHDIVVMDTAVDELMILLGGKE
jgi:large subunit ribosomal protein L4